MKLDDTDWALLRQLQRDARITNKQLAISIGLSASACHARVRKLEALGVIAAYRAMLNWRLLGAVIDAWVELVVETDRSDAFVGFLSDASVIVSAQRLAQTNAYLVHFVGESTEAWHEFLSAAERAGFALEVARFNLALDCVKAPSIVGPPRLRVVA